MLKLIGGIWDLLSSIIGAVSNLFGFLKQRDAEMNSPQMVQNKINTQVQDQKNKINQDLQQNNIEELGKDIAE